MELNFEATRNLKRQTLQIARFSEIEQENKVLLNKIFHIMQKSNKEVLPRG